MKKKNIAWGLFFIFLAAVYLVISSTGMELGVGLPGIFMTVLFVWLFVEGIKDVNFYSIVFAIAFICILYRKPLGLEKLGLTSWTILGAALLLSIGLSMIFKDVRRKNWKTKTINWDEQMSTPNGEQCSGEHIRCENNFGSAIRYINSEHFCDAQLENNFGSMSVYFDNAIIAGEAASVEVENNFGAVPLGGVGMLTLAMEYNLSGEATLTVEKEFEAGFAYSDGFRIVGNSHKKGFSFSAEADLTTGIVLSAKATLGIVSGDIYAKTGARMNIKYVRYSSGTPTYCASQAAYLYASVGASAKIGVGIASKTFSKSIEIWGKNNSPVRVYYHIEDGVLRTSCTRGKEFAAQCS